MQWCQLCLPWPHACGSRTLTSTTLYRVLMSMWIRVLSSWNIQDSYSILNHSLNRCVHTCADGDMYRCMYICIYMHMCIYVYMNLHDETVEVDVRSLLNMSKSRLCSGMLQSWRALQFSLIRRCFNVAVPSQHSAPSSRRTTLFRHCRCSTKASNASRSFRSANSSASTIFNLPCKTRICSVNLAASLLERRSLSDARLRFWPFLDLPDVRRHFSGAAQLFFVLAHVLGSARLHLLLHGLLWHRLRLRRQPKRRLLIGSLSLCLAAASARTCISIHDKETTPIPTPHGDDLF